MLAPKKLAKRLVQPIAKKTLLGGDGTLESLKSKWFYTSRLLSLWQRAAAQNDHGGFGCTLKRHPADCAGPPPIWMHGRNRVLDQPALDEGHPGGGAGTIMRTILRCSWGPPSVEDGNGSSSNSPTGRHALVVHGTAIYTEDRCTPHLSPGIWPTSCCCIHP